MVRTIVEDGGVMAAVSEKGDQDAPGNRQEDIVHVMVPVNEQSASNET